MMRYSIRTVAILLAAALLFAFSACGKKVDGETAASAQPTEKASAEKTESDDVGMLAVYFPYDGISEKTASAAADITGAGLFALETVNGYSDSDDERAEQAKREAAEKARPALKNRLEAMTPYRVLFLCAPLWENDLPMAVYTFLEDYDFRDRVIVPFCSSGGEDDAERFAQLIREKLPGAAVTDAMPIPDSDFDTAAVGTFIDNVLNG